MLIRIRRFEDLIIVVRTWFWFEILIQELPCPGIDWKLNCIANGQTGLFTQEKCNPIKGMKRLERLKRFFNLFELEKHICP